MKTIYGNYKIDDAGNIYSKRGLLKLKVDNNYYRVNINQKWVSYARVVATYLVPNPNNFDRLIFKDRNPLNCSIENLKWVSEQKYELYVYKAQMKNKVLEKEEAIKKCKCHIIKKYYYTGNIDIINNHFISISKEIGVDYWKDIMGFVYIKVIEKLQRFTILYDLKVFILSRLQFYKSSGATLHYH